MFKSLALAGFAMTGCSSPAEAGANVIVTSPTPQITQVTISDEATFNEPWAMAFLPGSNFALITEKAGKLKFWRPGQPAQDVRGVPQVAYGGQGGLGDVVLSPDFAKLADRMSRLHELTERFAESARPGQVRWIEGALISLLR
mgnify:CR=1 FL=1